MTAGRPATTTISTIAIRSGERTRIVIAVLRVRRVLPARACVERARRQSVDWVHLRIDEMTPAMLEFGRDVAEAGRLLQVHENLMEQLRAKQEMIEELLSQADGLVTQQREPQAAVYEAMADSLGSAWKDLNRQLHLRGQLLQQTVRFYTLVQQHDQLFVNMSRQAAASTPLVDTAKEDFLRTTAEAMESGAEAIGQIRALGDMADNEERPRQVQAACELVETHLLRLGDRCQQLAASWPDRRAQTDARRADLQRLAAWLRASVDAALESGRSFGVDLAGATDFLGRHKQLASDIIRREPDVFAMLNRPSDPRDGELNRQVAEFNRRWESIQLLIERRIQLGGSYQQFHKLAKEMSLTSDARSGLLSAASDGADEGTMRQLERLNADTTQTMARLRHEAERFLSDSRGVAPTDPHLDVRSAADCVRRLLSELEATQQQLHTRLSEWKSHQALAQHSQSMLDEIEIWIVELTELVVNAEKRSQNVATADEADRLLNEMGRSQQDRQRIEANLRQIDDAGRRLHCTFAQRARLGEGGYLDEQTDARAVETRSKYTCIVDRLLIVQRRVESLAHSLRQRESQRPPTFTQHLRDTQVDEGTRVELQARLTGEPAPTVVWKKDGAPVMRSADCRTSELNGVCTLRIDEALVDDAGVFVCRAENAAGVAESGARLTVKPKIDVEANKPKFVKQLVNLSVTERETVRLECAVVGNPEPEVLWLFDERPIKESNAVRLMFEGDRCVLVISEAQLSHAGIFKCIARNPLGEATSFCRLSVHPAINYEAPTIEPPLHNQIVNEGDALTLEARVLGEPAPVVAWLLDGRPLRESADVHLSSDGNGWQRLHVRRVTAELTGEYGVRAENAAGQARSVASVTIGQTTTTQRYVVEEFASSAEMHLGLSPSATAPEFVRPFNAEYRLALGSKARLECLLVGNPRPKVAWSFDGRPVVSGDDFCQLTNVGDTYAVILPRVTAEHAGTFALSAENIRGRADTVARIVVTAPEVAAPTPTFTKMVMEREATRSPIVPPKTPMQPPHFSQTLVSVICADGESAHFVGHVSGFPTPDVCWHKDGQPVNASTHPELRCSHANGQVTLTFPVARAHHSGKYTCTAKNQAGVASSSAQLVVRAQTTAPDFAQRLISREVGEGEEVQWTVVVTGDPPPTVEWQRNGARIDHCAQVQIGVDGGGRHSLRVVAAEAADAGQFTVIALNAAGEARSSADLVVRARGAAPGQYFHVTKVTQERQVAGREVSRNQALTLEQPPSTPPRF